MNHIMLKNATLRSMRLPLALLITAVLVMTLVGCGSGGPGPTSPPQGFYIQSMFWSGLMMMPDVGARGQACRSDSLDVFAVASNCFPPSNHAAEPRSWGPTAGDGRDFLSTTAFPANWDFIQTSSNHCNVSAQASAKVTISGQIVQIMCQSFPSASMSPSSVVSGSASSSLTIWGSGISNEYGPPQVMIYNEFGNVVATASATSIASDQSSLTIPMPDFTGVADGTYEVVVGIYDSTNTLQPVLGTSVKISGYAPPPPPPPDPPPSDCGANACLIAS